MENILTSKQTEIIKRIIKNYPQRLYDVLNAFNKNQYENKEWLIKKLNHYSNKYHFFNKSQKDIDIAIMGGWYGLLGELLYSKFITKPVRNIISYDIDPMAKKLGIQFTDNITFQTEDVKNVDWKNKTYSICINTSCEHMEQSLLDDVINSIRDKTLVVLQSNNYKNVDQHINCVDSLDDFKERYSKYFNQLKGFELYIKKEDYTRFMLIGIKKCQ